MWNASPAGRFILRNQTDAVVSPSTPASERIDEKASSRPSADHWGFEALKAGLVRRSGGSEPSAGASQISLCRRSSSLSASPRTNAT